MAGTGGSASEILRCRGPWHREIVLATATWVLHILPQRSALRGNEGSVQLTLTDPHVVMHDATHGVRENFYRFGALPAPYDHLYLKVCVAFDRPGGDGRVVTACPTRQFQPGERRKQP